MDELKKNKSKEKIEQAQKALAAMREQLKGKNWQPTMATPQEVEQNGFAIGDKVWLVGMGLQGQVLSEPDNNGQLEVQIGNTKVRMSPENLEKAKSSSRQPAGVMAARSSLPRRAVSMELDLRGKRADGVEIELDAYLNDASLANLPEVRIIHGVATGTVRQIVRQFLAGHPLVQSFRSGKREEGGDGVTLVKL
jgi:DNA mismatch repair protein MutS2